MNVKLRVLTAGVVFFTGQLAFAQDSTGSSRDKEQKIEEVVVLGYNKTQTKPKDVTASTTVSAEKLENRPNVSFLNSLQGEAAGLSINSTSGSPGSSKIDVIIRGVGSINASTEPLYVVDGMISNSVQFRNLNPNDLESVSVLKDAAATSIYGSRGANGVIVIRTKQGKYGKRFDVSYSGTVGMSLIPRTDYNMASSKQILTLQNRVGVGEGSELTDAQIAAYNGPDTNWNDELFQTGFTQSHDLSMMFGGENVNDYFSVGYLDQTGTVPTTDFKRFTLRNNLNGKSTNGRFTYNSNIALGYSKRHQLDQETNGNIASNVIQNPLLAAIVGLPTIESNKYKTGPELLAAIGSDYGGGKNVWVLQDVLRGTLPNLLTETSIVTNFSASYKLTDELTVTNRSGMDYKYNERIFARSPYSFLGLITARNSRNATLNPDPFGGIEVIQKTREFNFNSVTSVNYHKVINDDHTFDVGAYMDWMKVHYNSTSQQQTGLYPKTWVFGAGTGYVAPVYYDNPIAGQDPIVYYVPTASAGQITGSTLAYFLTLDYDYKSKYGFSGVIRRDGTYRFTGDNRWATFWSAAGRWNIDQEDFMEGSVFNMLKLRASYGIQGNQNVVAAAYGTNPLLQSPNLIREFDSQSLGYANTQGAYYFSGRQNPYLQWEEVGQANIGIDYRLWNNKIEGSVDVYNKKTDKLFSSLNVSAITGDTSLEANNGSLQNRGIEVMLRYNIIKTENASVSIYGNTAYNKSKILSLVKDDNAGNVRNVTGGMLGEWYLIRYAGVNKDNGNMLFLDKDGNVTETPNTLTDQVKSDKSYLPKWNGGFGFNTSYKNFFLDAHFSYQADVWRYDNQLNYVLDPTTVNNYNVSADLLNAWTPTNQNTNVPSLQATNFDQAGSSDRYLKDASFVKLKVLTLGYNLPKSMIGDSIRSMKIFVSGENLFMFTKWKGYDPEPTFAVSTSVYPNLRTVTLGVNLDF